MAVLRALCIVLLACTASAQEETPVPEEAPIPPADEWYKNDYAPLFGDKPWDHAAELAEHFTETVRLHNESIETVQTLEWLSEALQELKIGGWIRSEIADVEFDQINSTTASFKTKWRDYFNGGNVGYDCTWYLAGFVDGAWKITDLAGITCVEHGL